MASTTSAGRAYEFSLVFNRTGTSIRGAPYGNLPLRSSRIGGSSIIVFLPFLLLADGGNQSKAPPL
jgi:hypothetical protein